LVLKLIEMPAQNVTIMDFADNRGRVKDALSKGVRYVIDRVTPENYKKLLAQYAGPGDMIIDLAWNIRMPGDTRMVPRQSSVVHQYFR